MVIDLGDIGAEHAVGDHVTDRAVTAAKVTWHVLVTLVGHVVEARVGRDPVRLMVGEGVMAEDEEGGRGADRCEDQAAQWMLHSDCPLRGTGVLLVTGLECPGKLMTPERLSLCYRDTMLITT